MGPRLTLRGRTHRGNLGEKGGTMWGALLCAHGGSAAYGGAPPAAFLCVSPSPVEPSPTAWAGSRWRLGIPGGLSPCVGRSSALKATEGAILVSHPHVPSLHTPTRF